MSEEKFDIKLMEEWEKTIKKTKQRINLVICGRAGAHSEYLEYFNWTGRKLRTKENGRRVYGIGLTAFGSTQPLDRIYNDKRPVIIRVPYKKRNRDTGELETKYKPEKSGEFIYGWKAIAQHLSKFVPITEDELMKLVEKYLNVPRIYFYTAYEDKGVSIHDQPKNIEQFMGFKNFWIVSSGKPIMCDTAHSDQRFQWLNDRIKKLAKANKLKGYWQIRISPIEEETI